MITITFAINKIWDLCLSSISLNNFITSWCASSNKYMVLKFRHKNWASPNKASKNLLVNFILEQIIQDNCKWHKIEVFPFISCREVYIQETNTYDNNTVEVTFPTSAGLTVTSMRRLFLLMVLHLLVPNFLCKMLLHWLYTRHKD